MMTMQGCAKTPKTTQPYTHREKHENACPWQTLPHAHARKPPHRAAWPSGWLVGLHITRGDPVLQPQHPVCQPGVGAEKGTKGHKGKPANEGAGQSPQAARSTDECNISSIHKQLL